MACPSQYVSSGQSPDPKLYGKWYMYLKDGDNTGYGNITGQPARNVFLPHLKTFSDSLVTTKRNPKLPSMVLKTLGPSLQPCPQPLQSQGMAHRSPQTCKFFQILCLFLPHPHLWWTPLPHSNIMSFRKVSMILSD